MSTSKKFFFDSNYIDGVTVVDERGLPESKSGRSDSRNRTRVSTSTPLLTATNIIDEDSNFWSHITAGGGTIAHNAQASLLELAVGTTSGDSAINQTIRYVPYSPGHGSNVHTTFTMAPAQTGLVQKVGPFDDNNGIFLQQDGTAVSIVIRDNSSGSPIDTTYAQSTWTDPLDGSGPSGYTLDLTKIQHFTIDFDWSGSGAIRCFFILTGTPYNFFTIDHANLVTSPYMANPNLPVRFEIANTSTTAAAATMYVSCAVVQSEESSDIEGSIFVCDSGNTEIDTSTAPTLNMIVRLKKYYNGVPNRRSLSLQGGSIFNSGADTIYRIYHNTTPTYQMTVGTITGTFQVGETITGGTSGATATITAINASVISYQETNQFNFSTGETITGITSGASAPITVVTTWLTTSAHSPFEYATSSAGFSAAYQILIYSSILATPGGKKGLAGDFPSSDLNKHGDINLDYSGFNPQTFSLVSRTLSGSGTTWSSLVFREV